MFFGELGTKKAKYKRDSRTEEPLSFMKMVSLLNFFLSLFLPPTSCLTKPVFIADHVEEVTSYLLLPYRASANSVL